MIEEDYLLKQRIKAWVYIGVETEVELAGLVFENKYLKENDSSSEDIDYNNKHIKILQAKLETINNRIVYCLTQNDT